MTIMDDIVVGIPRLALGPTPSAPRPPWSRRACGGVGFSDLKMLAESPAHYREHMVSGYRVSRAMNVGTVGDRLLVGREGSRMRPPVIWRGGTTKKGEPTTSRASVEYKAFAAQYPDDEVITPPEADEGRAVAEAVLLRPLARAWLDGDKQVPLAWLGPHGVPLVSGGVDCLNAHEEPIPGETRYPGVGGGHVVVDLKISSTSKPRRLHWHQRDMLWYVQVTMLHDGCVASGVVMRGNPVLLVACAKPPHCVTACQLTDRTMARGRRQYTEWCDLLLRCEAADTWPDYEEATIPLDMEDDDVAIDLEGIAEGVLP